MFLLVSFRRRPEQMGTNIASPYKALRIKVNYCPQYFAYEKFNQPETWRTSLYIHLLTFPVFWTVSINLRGRPLKGKGKGIPGAREEEKRARGGVGNAGKDANVVFFVHIYQRDKEILID